jgi:hypothetical protein
LAVVAASAAVFPAVALAAVAAVAGDINSLLQLKLQ